MPSRSLLQNVQFFQAGRSCSELASISPSTVMDMIRCARGAAFEGETWSEGPSMPCKECAIVRVVHRAVDQFTVSSKKGKRDRVPTVIFKSVSRDPQT